MICIIDDESTQSRTLFPNCPIISLPLLPLPPFIIRIIRLIGVFAADFDSFHAEGASGFGVDFGEGTAEADVAGGDFEGMGHVGGHVFEDAIFAAAEDGIVGTAHAEVGDDGTAAGEEAGVGGGDVGVGADDHGAAAVEPVAHGDFFAGGLGVHVADGDAHSFGHVGKNPIGGGEGIVGGKVHVDSAEEGKNADGYAGVGGDDGVAAAGGSAGEIGGTNDSLAGLEGWDDVGLAVDVIAEGDDIDAVAADFVKEVGGDSAAAGDVFGIGDDEIDGAFADEIGQFLMKNLPPGATDNIAETQDAKGHGGRITAILWKVNAMPNAEGQMPNERAGHPVFHSAFGNRHSAFFL